MNRPLLSIVVAFALVSGCVGGDQTPAEDSTVSPTNASEPTATETDWQPAVPNKSKTDNVGETLTSFLESENRTQAAEERDIPYRPADGTVAIVAYPAEKRTVPTERFASVEFQHADGRIRGWLPVNAVRPLAADPNVSLVTAGKRPSQGALKQQLTVSIRDSATQLRFFEETTTDRRSTTKDA